MITVKTTREKMIDYIKKNPFCTKKNISQALDITIACVSYHINIIDKTHQGLIKDYKKIKYKPVDTYRFSDVRVNKKHQ